MATRNKGTVPWKIQVPADLALRIELRYCNEVSGRPRYGARSHFIVALLRAFERATIDQKITSPDAIHALVSRLLDESEAEEKLRHEQQQPT